MDDFTPFRRDLVAIVQMVSPRSRLIQNKYLSNTELFTSSDELEDHQSSREQGQVYLFREKRLKLIYGANFVQDSVVR